MQLFLSGWIRGSLYARFQPRKPEKMKLPHAFENRESLSPSSGLMLMRRVVMGLGRWLLWSEIALADPAMLVTGLCWKR